MADSYTDYPQAARDNAKAALRYAEQNGWGSCGTPVGKVSFDYDDTLTTDKGKELLRRRQQQGDEIYIITARRRSVEVIDFAREYGIKNVYFTAGADKWQTVLELNIDVHYDNNAEQIRKINENTNAKGILI